MTYSTVLSDSQIAAAHKAMKDISFREGDDTPIGKFVGVAVSEYLSVFFMFVDKSELHEYSKSGVEANLKVQK